ncbi:unnamed protein product [Amoebophrya sp. A120]|nr:unnamed protein product [Amoebophrya sp. A120]|eukprot:GSA120T00019794001.1
MAAGRTYYNCKNEIKPAKMFVRCAASFMSASAVVSRPLIGAKMSSSFLLQFFILVPELLAAGSSATTRPTAHFDWKPLPGTKNIFFSSTKDTGTTTTAKEDTAAEIENAAERQTTKTTLLVKDFPVLNFHYINSFVNRRNFTRVMPGFAYHELPDSLKGQAASVVTHDNPYWDAETRKELQAQSKMDTIDTRALPPTLRFLPVKNKIHGGYDLISFSPPRESVDYMYEQAEQIVNGRSESVAEKAVLPKTKKKQLMLEIGSNSRNLLMDEDKKFVEAADETLFIASFEPLLDKWSYLLSRFREAPNEKNAGVMHKRGVALPFAVGPCDSSSTTAPGYLNFHVMELDGASSVLPPAGGSTASAERNKVEPKADHVDKEQDHNKSYDVEYDIDGNPVYKVRHTNYDMQKLRERVASGLKEVRQVPCVTLETVLSDWFRKFDEVKLIKIDAQGLDLKIIESASGETLRRKVKEIELEVLCENRQAMYENGATCGETVKKMEAKGFELADKTKDCEFWCGEFGYKQLSDVQVDEINLRFQRTAGSDTDTALTVTPDSEAAPSTTAKMPPGAGAVDETLLQNKEDDSDDGYLKIDLQITSPRGATVEVAETETATVSKNPCLELRFGTERHTLTAAQKSSHVDVDSTTALLQPYRATCSEVKELILEPSLHRYAKAIADSSGRKADNYGELGVVVAGAALSTTEEKNREAVILPFAFCRVEEESTAIDRPCIEQHQSDTPTTITAAAHFFSSLVPTIFPQLTLAAIETLTLRLDFFRFSDLVVSQPLDSSPSSTTFLSSLVDYAQESEDVSSPLQPKVKKILLILEYVTDCGFPNDVEMFFQKCRSMREEILKLGFQEISLNMPTAPQAAGQQTLAFQLQIKNRKI